MPSQKSVEALRSMKAIAPPIAGTNKARGAAGRLGAGGLGLGFFGFSLKGKESSTRETLQERRAREDITFIDNIIRGEIPDQEVVNEQFDKMRQEKHEADKRDAGKRGYLAPNYNYSNFKKNYGFVKRIKNHYELIKKYLPMIKNAALFQSGDYAAQHIRGRRSSAQKQGLSEKQWAAVQYAQDFMSTPGYRRLLLEEHKSHPERFRFYDDDVRKKMKYLKEKEQALQ